MNIEKECNSFPRSGSLYDLLGKKSVRATFKLRPEAIEMLSVLAAQLGIKQKSLFDYLMEDEEALHAIAQSQPHDTAENNNRVQKTFVVSQRSLSTLEGVTKHAAASRNDLIEQSIQRLLPVFEKERERQDKREDAFACIKNHFEQANLLLDEIKEKLGKEDILYSPLEPVMVQYAKAFADIKILNTHPATRGGNRLIALGQHTPLDRSIPHHRHESASGFLGWPKRIANLTG